MLASLGAFTAAMPSERGRERGLNAAMLLSMVSLALPVEPSAPSHTCSDTMLNAKTQFGALGIAAVISAAFVYASLTIWKLEYGKVMSGPFFSMLTRRDRAEEDF